MVKCPHTLLLFFLLKYTVLFGQNFPIKFRHIAVEDGLSQGNASCLMKDSRGFLWVGTQDGLNCFDGYSFRHFQHEPGNPASLSNNYVWCLLEDSQEDIWVGTFDGTICRFDRETETFKSFPLAGPAQPAEAGNAVRSMCEFPKGTLWLGADKGIWSLDIKTQELKKKQFRAEGAATFELENVVALQPMPDRQMLAAAAQGLFHINLHTSKIKPVKLGAPLTAATAIVPVAADLFWIGTQGGLFQVKYFPKNDSLAMAVHYSQQAKNSNTLPSNIINSLFYDGKGVLWIGTNEGLCRFDSNGFSNFQHEEANPHSLVNDLVFSILEVEPGLMWTGTREGISVFSNQAPTFQNLSFEGTNGGLCSDAVLGMLEDREGNVWIGTRKGLTRIGHFSGGKEQWEIECLTPASTPSMPFDYVINLFQNPDGTIWCAFRRQGFAMLKKDNSGKWFFQAEHALKDILGGAGVNTMLFDDDKVWLGTPGLGLVEWNQRKGGYEVFADDGNSSLKHNYIFCLKEDSQGRLWLGAANGGLCWFDKKTKAFTCYVQDDANAHSISSNMVLSIFEDSQQRLWACTANGLNLMEQEGRFRRFFKKDGLPNDVVYGMLEDGEGNLWASTNRGLSKINFQNGVFKTQNFTATDGLPGNEFNQHSFLKIRDGKLLFGGTGGLTIFDPKAIRPNTYMPPVVLTDFQLFGQSQGIGGVLKKAINETEEITLPHHQNFIALEFAALGFSQIENIEYAYMLEGLDVDWVRAGNRRFASYPKLPPGNYVFKIKAANHDGIWSKTPKILKINVLPPWWRTWWAYLLYVLGIGTAVFSIFKFRVEAVRRIEQAKVVERERFRERMARDFHDEAGNKITKMSLLTEIVRRQLGSSTTFEPLLAQMEENIQELRAGMRDFIWVLDPVNDNLYDTLIRLKDFGNGLFVYSSTHFTTEGIHETMRTVPIDGSQRRHLLLIFKEAMNNCVKYAEADEAILSVKKQDDLLELRFSDNGNGFDLEKTSGGNGLKNMKARVEKMGGDFSIQSEPGGGTTVIWTFKTS